MAHWWGSRPDDWEERTSAAAFRDHYIGWWLAARKGRGWCYALVDDAGLAGEVHMYVKDRHLFEMGLWCAPGRMGRASLLTALAWQADVGLLLEGRQRVEAPLAVSNDNPVPLLKILGLTREGTLRSYRMLGGRPVDMHLFALTRDDWLARRPSIYAKWPWPSVPTVGVPE